MKTCYDTDLGIIYNGDCLETLKSLPDGSVNTCVTSPPYWGLRDYGTEGQLGLEPTPEEYTANMVEVFREVKRVLRDDGTLWLNLGDSYATHGSSRGKGQFGIDMRNDSRNARSRKKIEAHKVGLKEKDLIGIPWRVAFALQADGWYLRSDIIWHKPNPMPESVTDRPTKSHEYIFLLSKSQKYYYDADAIKEPVNSSNPVSSAEYRKNIGRGGNNRGVGNFDVGTTKKPMGNSPDGMKNKRSVWTVSTKPYSEAHFATFPPKLIEPCILAGCPKDGVVLDPFFGAGTTGVTAYKHDRKFLGIELNEEYCEIARNRVRKESEQIKIAF